MEKRKGLMGHMVAGLDQDTGLMGMTKSNVADLWIHLIGRKALMDSILVLVLRYIIIITANILLEK